MTHVSGTPGPLNRPANMKHACRAPVMTHIGWDRPHGLGRLGRSAEYYGGTDQIE
jgi:hypothetical protein